jgi:uncharacterized membrane protein SirB2
MEWIKHLHISCALLSFCGFFVRGIWMLQESHHLQSPWVRISPHIIDTLLLVSAITLAINLNISPFEHSWLLAKIIALLVYIGLGMIALHHGRNKAQRVSAWLLGLLTFIYIANVAFSRSPWGPMALI